MQSALRVMTPIKLNFLRSGICISLCIAQECLQAGLITVKLFIERILISSALFRRLPCLEAVMPAAAMRLTTDRGIRCLNR